MFWAYVSYWIILGTGSLLAYFRKNKARKIWSS